jgi:hypothetical protein
VTQPIYPTDMLANLLNQLHEQDRPENADRYSYLFYFVTPARHAQVSFVLLVVGLYCVWFRSFNRCHFGPVMQNGIGPVHIGAPTHDLYIDRTKAFACSDTTSALSPVCPCFLCVCLCVDFILVVFGFLFD